MMEHEQRMPGLAANLAVFILSPLVMNGIIFGLGWDRASASIPGVPPGPVVGVIWMLLFTGMGVARRLLVRARRGGAEWVSLLALVCLLFPLYTVGLRSMVTGLVGTLLTAVLAIAVVRSSWNRSREAAVCVAAVCVWLLYAGAASAHSLLR
jgi:tryptophan-rich sensory protein